jgi:hypothetical protein
VNVVLQFRVTVDDAFLDYLARDGVLIELWAQKRDISAERVASAKLPLSSMLQARHVLFCNACFSNWFVDVLCVFGNSARTDE